MATVTQAFIFPDAPRAAAACLFTADIAGIALFKRWVLTLNRSGISTVRVFLREADHPVWRSVAREIAADPRFSGALHLQREDGLRSEAAWWNDAGREDAGVLMAGGHIVASPVLLKAFIQEACRLPHLPEGRAVSLENPADGQGEVFIVPASRREWLGDYAAGRKPAACVGLAMSSVRHDFWTGVTGRRAARRAEAQLVRQSRYDYHQFMDVVINSFFARWITRLAVKTPLTPNQLTLMGLVIAAAAGVLFAQGGYSAGLAGGLVTAATAIWDCVDGAVARLKFMQSDFGEYLDTLCDNITNIFVFLGITIGVARDHSLSYALIPCALLTAGGLAVYFIIYSPRAKGKGGLFRGTKMYEIVQALASRNFIYVIVLFALIGRLDWFLWLAGFGSLVFAAALSAAMRKITAA